MSCRKTKLDQKQVIIMSCRKTKLDQKQVIIMTLATTVQLQLTHRDGSETHKNFDSMVQLMPFFEQNRHTAMAAKIVYGKANVAHHPNPFDPSEVWLDFTGEFMISNSELTDERVMKEAKLAGAQNIPKRARKANTTVSGKLCK